MVRLILVRHGETAWNTERRYQGGTDVPLGARGRAQAQALVARLSGRALDAIYSSDLKRAWQTATAIAASHELEVRAEPRLREMGFGAWEGLTYDEIRQRWPQALAEWEAAPLIATPPGGEGLTRFAARAREVLDDLTRLYQGEAVVLVAHGGPLRVLVCLALGLAPPAYWQFRLSLASVSELYLYPCGAILALLNDQHHLAE